MAKGTKKVVEIEQTETVSTTPLNGAENKEVKVITTTNSISKGSNRNETPNNEYNVIVYGGEFYPYPQILSGNVIDILTGKGYKIEYVD